jgi:hypothetical protein
MIEEEDHKEGIHLNSDISKCVKNLLEELASWAKMAGINRFSTSAVVC